MPPLMPPVSYRYSGSSAMVVVIVVLVVVVVVIQNTTLLTLLCLHYFVLLIYHKPIYSNCIYHIFPVTGGFKCRLKRAE